MRLLSLYFALLATAAIAVEPSFDELGMPDEMVFGDYNTGRYEFAYFRVINAQLLEITSPVNGTVLMVVKDVKCPIEKHTDGALAAAGAAYSYMNGAMGLRYCGVRDFQGSLEYLVVLGDCKLTDNNGMTLRDALVKRGVCEHIPTDAHNGDSISRIIDIMYQ